MTYTDVFKVIEPDENRRKYLEQIYKDFNKYAKIYDLVILLHLVGYLRKRSNRRVLDDAVFKFNQKLKNAVISFLEKYKFVEYSKNQAVIKDKKIDIQKIKHEADAVMLESINKLLSRFDNMEYSVYGWYDNEVKDLALELKMSLLLKVLLIRYMDSIFKILSNQEYSVLLIEPSFDEYIKYFSLINPKIDIVVFRSELEDLLQILIPSHQGKIFIDTPMLSSLKKEIRQSYDYVVSFLPFSFLQENKITELLQGISMVTSGEFVFYQYTKDTLPYGLNVMFAFFTDYNATLTNEKVSNLIGRFALKHKNHSPIWVAQL